MSNIKPFSRDAEYFYRRALANIKSGHLMDALDLIRGAIEREPENPDYHHELALIYSELGCPKLSNRALISMIGLNLFKPESMFIMGGNYIMLGDLRAANSLIIRYVSADPERLLEPVVQHAVAKVMGGSAILAVTSPGAWYHYQNGELLARRGSYQRALSELNKCLARRAANRPVLALRAVCLARLGHQTKARAAARSLLTDSGLTAGCICNAALALALSGAKDEALSALGRAMTLDRTAAEQNLLLDAAIEAGDHQFSRRAALDMLNQRPYDMRALHVAAVAAMLVGEPFETAKPYWARIMRLDPADSVASYYLASGPDMAQPEYAQAVPEPERLARLEYLSGISPSDSEAEWLASERFRHMLAWAILSGAGHDSAAVRQHILAIRSPGLEQVLREHLITDNIPAEFRRAMIRSLARRGATGPLFARDERGRVTDIAPRHYKREI